MRNPGHSELDQTEEARIGPNRLTLQERDAKDLIRPSGRGGKN